MMVLLFNHLTISRCSDLKVEDLHLKKKQIEIMDRLTVKYRKIQISTNDLIQIRDYLNYGRPILTRFNQKEESFFVSTTGHRIHPKSLYKRVQYLRKKSWSIKGNIPNTYQRYLV